jgi:hypothetical protein
MMVYSLAGVSANNELDWNEWIKQLFPLFSLPVAGVELTSWVFCRGLTLSWMFSNLMRGGYYLYQAIMCY